MSQVPKIQYLESACIGVRDSLMESYCLEESEIRNRQLEPNKMIIYKDKKPISFEAAFKKKKV